MNRLLASIFRACLSACSVSQPSLPADPSPNAPSRVAEYEARYAGDYAVYRCAKSEFPATQVHQFTLGQFQAMALSRQLKLRLKLGSRFDQPGTFTYRTGSNYILSSASGKELGRAESMLLKENSAGSNEPIKVIFTPQENSVLIEEENFGAGGSTRHVVFVPSTNEPAAWQAFHLDLPARATGVGTDDHIGTVGGISQGKIYVEMDSLFYAFPLEKFVMTELGVSNG